MFFFWIASLGDTVVKPSETFVGMSSFSWKYQIHFKKYKVKSNLANSYEKWKLSCNGHPFFTSSSPVDWLVNRKKFRDIFALY